VHTLDRDFRIILLARGGANPLSFAAASARDDMDNTWWPIVVARGVGGAH
jgi:hypothetical protein